MPLDTFFKLSAEDPESKCNVITPLNPSDLERDINPRTGRVITADDRTAAKRAFARIANARGAMVGVCCDPSSNFQKHDKEILEQLRAKYPSVRLVKNNADEIVEIELSRVKKPVAKGWIQISPYLVCRIMNATLRDDPNDTDVVRAGNLTKDCYTENCDTASGLTLEALYGSMPSAEFEYTANDDSRLARAIEEGDASYVEEYLRKYNKINQTLTHNNYRQRIIHLVAKAGYTEKKHIKVMDLVLAALPRLDVRDYLGNMPIHTAVVAGQIDAVDRLLKYGGSSKAGINAKNNRGETPIMLAVAYHSPTHKEDTVDGRTTAVFASMARMLYNNGANIMDVDNQGNNILHHIILNSPDVHDKSRLVYYFIERGANGEQANNNGDTPLSLTGDLLGDYKHLDPEPEETDEQREARKWIMHDLPKNTNNNSSGGAKEGFRSQPMPPRYNVNDPPSIKFETDMRKDMYNNSKHHQLSAIQTILFNNHIRQNPHKYNGPVNVTEIPRGAPIIVQHYMCSADGSTDNPTAALHDLDSREECEKRGAHWVKISKPTTMVQVSLIPEGDSYIDEMPQDQLYYNKHPESTVYKPLPEEVQKLNSEVRSINKSGTDTTSRYVSGSKPLTSSTAEGREGFEDINGEYVSRGPMPGLHGSNGPLDIDNLSQEVVGEPHPSVCRGIKANAEAANARMRTNKILANGFKNSDTVQRVGKFMHDNVALFLVLILLMVIFLWQLSRCHL